MCESFILKRNLKHTWITSHAQDVSWLSVSKLALGEKNYQRIGYFPQSRNCPGIIATYIVFQKSQSGGLMSEL